MRHAHQWPISLLNQAKPFEAPSQSVLEYTHHPEAWLQFKNIAAKAKFGEEAVKNKEQ